MFSWLDIALNISYVHKLTILKVLVKVEFNNVHGWEVHEPKAEACHDPNGDIEDGKGWGVKIFDGESSYQQTKGR